MEEIVGMPCGRDFWLSDWWGGWEIATPGDGGFADGEGEAMEVFAVWDFGSAELGDMGVV